jgi:Fe-S oxidoreductase
MAAREEAEGASVGHPALVDLAARVRAKAKKAAATAREAVPPLRVKTEAELAWLPGCEAPEAVTAALALLDRAGAEHVSLAVTSLGCGGYPLYAAGQHAALRDHAETVARELHGYARVAVACPACAWLMKHEYPRRGVELRPSVINAVELLDELSARLPAVSPSGAAYYHDPCYLGRHQGVYDAPRRLLKSAVKDVREFSRQRGEAECSGGGGVLPVTAPATAAAIAEHRLEEVREAGVRRVVTACPTCRRQLARDGVEVRDLIELVEEATRP